jgi:phosphoribosylformylglycinamidine cyclo-ligase
MKAILEKYRSEIHGAIHCSGGGQTKVLHFTEQHRIVKDNLFACPPLFRIIQEASGTSWEEMYKVFNMGHRLELYVPESISAALIEISRSFGVEAKIIGRVEASPKKELVIRSEFGEFSY